MIYIKHDNPILKCDRSFMAGSDKFLYNYPHYITVSSARFFGQIMEKKLVKKLKDCDVGSWRITRAFLAFDFFQTGVHFMNTKELFQLKH